MMVFLVVGIARIYFLMSTNISEYIRYCREIRLRQWWIFIVMTYKKGRAILKMETTKGTIIIIKVATPIISTTNSASPSSPRLLVTLIRTISLHNGTPNSNGIPNSNGQTIILDRALTSSSKDSQRSRKRTRRCLLEVRCSNKHNLWMERW